MTATEPRAPARVRIPFPRVDPDLDDALVGMSLRSESHPEASRSTRPLGSCRWCTHAWHGAGCTSDSDSSTACRCDSSFTSRDDSWRPRYVEGWVYRTHRLMDATGIDGYAAEWLTATPGTNMPYAARQQRLRTAVLQGARTP